MESESKLEWLEGVLKTQNGGGLAPPTMVFDTASSHSKFDFNSIKKSKFLLEFGACAFFFQVFTRCVLRN